MTDEHNRRTTLLLESQMLLVKRKLHTKRTTDILELLSNDTLEHLKRDLLNTSNRQTMDLNIFDPNTKRLYVFTDGACSNNGKVGAKASWAFVCDDPRIGNGSSLVTDSPTNQKAELTAIFKALERVNDFQHGFENEQIVICTDSMYSINCLTKWVKSWETNNWKTKNNKDVKNKIIIQDIIRLMRSIKLPIDFKHVFSHLQEPNHQNQYEHMIWHGNDRADRLATTLL